MNHPLDEMRQATPHAGDGAAREFIEGLIMMDDRIISVMSIPAIMPDAAPHASAETSLDAVI